MHSGGFIDIPKNNPGPAHYSPGRPIDEIHKPKSSEPGFAFQQDEKDFTAKRVARNRNPGPGQYEHTGIHSHTFNRALKGEIEQKYADDKSVPIVDNGVPGPGRYDPDDHLPVPNFKISQPSPRTKQYMQWDEATSVKEKIGPQSYRPKGHRDWHRGIKVGNSLRYEEKGTFMASPAPNRYRVMGDFDFRDPADFKNGVGKIPKFAFGIKPPMKPRGIDVPGPGTYETDCYPMNQ